MLYGIDGPRRRPRPAEASQDEVVIRVSAARPPSEVGSATPSSVRERWVEEATARAAEAAEAIEELAPAEAEDVPVVVVTDAPEHGRPEVLDRWLEALRGDVADAITQAILALRTTVDGEIEAMRSANREEAKRLRSSSGEELVRTRVATTEELARIRASIEAGVERLCRVIDGELDRMWSTNDLELERIRSTGTDRLVEVHDLLTEELARVRAAAPASSAEAADGSAPKRRRFHRKGSTAQVAR